MMFILGIETSCDETAAAIVSDGTRILSNIVSSQIDIHSRYGGIVPEVASRQHVLTILPVVEQAIISAKVNWQELAAVAVTYGPGLAGSLLIGVNVAKSIAFAHNISLIGVNHLEGHIYANWLTDNKPVFPCLCLIISGGHSDLVLMTDHGEFKKLGRTRDDAAGEAFDKAARILGLGYPGGPVIEARSQNVTPSLRLPRAWLKGTDDFSFSGLKTALFNLVQTSKLLDSSLITQAAASFQQAIIDVVFIKTVNAAKRLKVNQILLAGGVAANKALNNRFVLDSPIPVVIPPANLCTDNAAMIAACGYFRHKRGVTSSYDLDIVPSLSFD